MLLHFKCLLWLFPLLGILCSRHLRDKFSHFFQVFAQIYCFSEVYPDNPNLKLGLTQSNSFPWPLLFQIFFILIYFSVLITHHIWIYSKIYMFITYLLFIVFEWNISSRIIGIFVLFIAKSQAPTMVLGGWVLCEYVAWLDEWIPSVRLSAISLLLLAAVTETNMILSQFCFYMREMQSILGRLATLRPMSVLRA